MATSRFATRVIAEAYARYRPDYGKEVFGIIIDFCRETPCSFSLALDLGCGSGQSTVPLAKYFTRVIGVDVSEEQIAHAPTDVDNVSFRVGAAQNVEFLEKSSVDLVTIATAMHWMNVEEVYREVERVLKPGGSFVSYCYDLPVLDDKTGQEILTEFMKETSTHPDHLELYRSYYTLPFPDWRRKDDIQMEKYWSVDEVAGWLSSFSTFHEYLQRHPQSTLLEDTKTKLKKAYRTTENVERAVRLSFTVVMLMGHKPQK